uniref:Rho guanine nucleotide exchange factor 10 like n=1 Tax=Oreochromis niloticus TaxID=8128 RepID=A0A669EM47_ORENI
MLCFCLLMFNCQLPADVPGLKDLCAAGESWLCVSVHLTLPTSDRPVTLTNGTKEGLGRRKLAMIRKVSFLQRKDSTGDGKDDAGYMDVSLCEVKHPPPQLCPMPEGLSSQQVVRRLILRSIVQSESSYLDSLKRILQVRHVSLQVLSTACQCGTESRILQFLYYIQILHFNIKVNYKCSEHILFAPSHILMCHKQDFNITNHSHFITVYPYKWPTLYSDMLKNTPRSHSDRLPLQLALTELETLAEKLNEQKRVADQEAEIQHLAHSTGERNLNKLLNSEQRQLIHCELLTEIVFGDKGQVIKSKERKVFLINDTLICANVNLKGPPDINTLVPVGPKYTVKWSASLLQTQVVEVGQDSLQGKDGVITARYAKCDHVCVSGKVLLGPPRLYQELEELQHDLAVVEEVSLLVGTLHGIYQNLNTTVSQDWCLALQRLIRLKEEEIQNANKCRLRLSVPGKPDKSGHPVSIMVVFNTPNPFSKISWVNRLHLAKIAQRKENTSGWECAEEDGKTKALLSCPLLTCKLSVFSSRTHTLKLEAALHSPSQSRLLGFCTASTSLPQGYLWVAGGGGNSNHGQVEIFSLNRASARLVKTLPLRAPVLCLEYVKEPCPSTEEKTEKAQRAAKTGNIICVGLQDGSIHVQSSVDTAVQCLLTLVNPDNCPVLCLKHSLSFLFAGLANGKVAIYHRKTGERLWDVDSCRLMSLGSKPVYCLLALEDTVWASCENQVTVIQGDSLCVQSFEAHADPDFSVSHMVHSGGGVWMAFTKGSSIHLFHTETLQQLQEVNISTRTNYLSPGHICVSSLLISQGMLWVGTSQGVIITFSVPTLEGIPKITGKAMTSLNAHCGAVDFLVSASSTLASDLLRRDSIFNISKESANGEGGGGGGNVEGERGEQKLENSRHTENLETSPWKQDKPKHLLLQYHLHSTSQLPGKLLTAQPEQGNPRASPDLQMEDGSIYEVNEDPDVWLRGRPLELGKEGEAKRNKVTSTAIFSGGRGYRRIGLSSSEETCSDSSENTLLVWQLPLTLSQ